MQKSSSLPMWKANEKYYKVLIFGKLKSFENPIDLVLPRTLSEHDS